MEDNILNYLQSRYQPKNVNLTHKESLKTQDKIALLITRAIGTMYVVYIFIVFMGLWMFWQAWVSNQPFDPYPFAFLLFLANIVQLVLMPLIMVGQSLQNRHAEFRAQEEFEATQATFRDIEKILVHLDMQDKTLKKLLEKNFKG